MHKLGGLLWLWKLAGEFLPPMGYLWKNGPFSVMGVSVMGVSPDRVHIPLFLHYSSSHGSGRYASYWNAFLFIITAHVAKRANKGYVFTGVCLGSEGVCLGRWYALGGREGGCLPWDGGRGLSWESVWLGREGGSVLKRGVCLGRGGLPWEGVLPWEADPPGRQCPTEGRPHRGQTPRKADPPKYIFRQTPWMHN